MISQKRSFKKPAVSLPTHKLTGIHCVFQIIHFVPLQRKIQIVDAVIQCHKDKCLRAVNGLEVTNSQEKSLRDCVHRNGGIDEEVCATRNC